jgi:hypothetical protein
MSKSVTSLWLKALVYNIAYRSVKLIEYIEETGSFVPLFSAVSPTAREPYNQWYLWYFV